jgi:hypothetical protein
MSVSRRYEILLPLRFNDKGQTYSDDLTRIVVDKYSVKPLRDSLTIGTRTLVRHDPSSMIEHIQSLRAD